MVTEWFPPAERSVATGIFNTGSNVGSMVAPVFIPWLYFAFGWPLTFVLLGVAGLVWLACWLVWFDPPEKSRRVTSTELAHIRSGVVVTAAEKIPWSRLLRYREAWAYYGTCVLVGPVWWFYGFWLPDFFGKQFHLDLKHFGPPLVAIAVVTCLGSIGGGGLSAWLLRRGWPLNRARKTTSFLCACCTLPVIFAPRVDSVWLATAFFALAAAAAHRGWSATMYTVIGDIFPKDAVASVVGFGGTLASLVSLGFFWFVSNQLQGEGSYRTILVLCGERVSFGVDYFSSRRAAHPAPRRALISMPTSHPIAPALAPNPAPTIWRADRGDGTYQNPVLFADYSDPDCIRVGDDYWLTASSFCHVPGLPILHSRDLVNWTLVNHALPRLHPEEHFSQPRHGDGVWAPALRHYAGKFWIFYPDPDFGLYVVTADDPRGNWSTPVLVKSGRGLIDPCPFWDDDGQGYLIHGWARSRAGTANKLTLHRLAANSRGVTDAGATVIDGANLPGCHTLEGPKLYKRGGFYYIFAPAGGVRDGYQAVFRSRQIVGLYEGRIVLAQGSTAINGPHQGAWVDTPNGENWFLHFQERSAYGRVTHLQPMRWSDDGWPELGSARGEPVTTHRKPALPPNGAEGPATRHDFAPPGLGRLWQWEANPQEHWASLTAPARAPALGGRCRCRLDKRCGMPATCFSKNFPRQNLSSPPAGNFSGGARMATPRGSWFFGCDYAWLGWRREGTLNFAHGAISASCRRTRMNPEPKLNPGASPAVHKICNYASPRRFRRALPIRLRHRWLCVFARRRNLHRAFRPLGRREGRSLRSQRGGRQIQRPCRLQPFRPGRALTA